MTAPRTSPAEVRGLFRRVVAAAEAAGIDTADWRLVEGNETFDVSWAISTGPERIALGANPLRASLVLSGMARALELVPAKEAAK